MRRLFVTAAFALLLLGLAAGPAFAQTPADDNAQCRACHDTAQGTVPAQDFTVGAVDKAKCNSCHWLYKHYFDDQHTDSLSDYMTRQCADCHGVEFGWPQRPQPFIGFPNYTSPYGRFQAAASLDATPGQLHKIHVNGSWLKGDGHCNGCHGNAACDACHTSPQDQHTNHTLLAPTPTSVFYTVGKKFGDICPDTYMYAYTPTTNYNSASIVAVGQTSRGIEKTLISFPLAKLDGATFTTASVEFTRAGGAGGTMSLRAYRLRRHDWAAASATWNVYKAGSSWTAAGAGSSANDYFADIYAESTTGVFDVTALAQAAIAAGDTSLDLVIVDPAPVSGRYVTYFSDGTTFADYMPFMRLSGVITRSNYANPPVDYTVAYGSPIGNDQAAVNLPVTSTCVNDSCHSLAKAATVDFVPRCSECHPLESIGGSHEAVHTPTGVGSQCFTCHKDSLTQEHLHNPDTVSAALDCNTCHSSTKSSVVWSIFSGDKLCSACHLSAHALGLTANPTGIPKYPGFKWSPVMDSSLFSGETWLPSVYASGGQAFLSDRRTDATADGVFTFYRDQLAASGWTLTSSAPPSGATAFAASFSKNGHNVTVLFFPSTVAGGSDSVSTGSRIEILYK